MNFSDVQRDEKTRILANPSLGWLTVLIENDPDLTPDELAAYEQRFEDAIARTGFAAIVLSPSAQQVDASKDAGASLLLGAPIAVCENLEVSRSKQGAERHNGPDVVQQIIRALLKAYKFPAEPFGQPEEGKDGLVYYYLHPSRRHLEIAL